MTTVTLHRTFLRAAALAALLCVVSATTCAQDAQLQRTNQQPAQAAPSGTVTGTVLAQETQRPIRFANVQLQSVEAVAQANTGGARGALGGVRGGAAGRTEVDGTFAISGVAPGDYYVTASATGYIAERALLGAAVANGADPAQLLAGLPVVHVVAEQSSAVTVTLQRGGTLSGRMLWEDGSGAAGIGVSAVPPTQMQPLPAPLSGLALGGTTQFATTDDRGDFRITGLPSGDYQVLASIQTRAQGFGGPGSARGQPYNSVIRIYAPGVFRRAAARVYSVRAGDDRSDVRLSVDMRSLRTVSGHASNAAGSGDVKSGTITLVDATDNATQIGGVLDNEGGFLVRYVPPGNYILRIDGASTASNNSRGRGGDSAGTPAVTFQPFTQTLVVTDADLSGVGVSLTPVAASATPR